MQRLELMLRLLELQQLQPAGHDVSLSGLGLRTLEVLQQLDRVEEFAGDEAAGAAVLDAEQQALLAGCTSETEVVKHLTPALWRLRVANDDSEDACRDVLVNGENSGGWLDDPVTPLPDHMRLKPRLFKAPRMCVEVREGTGSQGSGDCYVFGRLAGRCLQLDGCVRELYEARVQALTLTDLGELVRYQQLIPGACRGMLFNGRHFWLFASLHGCPMTLVRGAWCAPGSASRICRFFDAEQPPQLPPPPPLVPLLRQLLCALRLRPAPERGSCFLGGGGSGRVFAVERVEQAARAAERMALKAVASSAADDVLWAHSLTREFRAMQRAAAQGAPVVPVVADSLRLLDGVGGGFLLARCGAPFDATASAAACAAAFASLAALHARDVLHGDAQLPNLLLVDGVTAWVDVSANAMARAEYPKEFATARHVDASALARSVLLAVGVQSRPLPAAVTAALAAYDDASTERVRALADAVWAAANGGMTADAATPEEAG
jgi:tRNA A-37 threonylcarbamoyl transferase component Bud32